MERKKKCNGTSACLSEPVQSLKWKGMKECQKKEGEYREHMAYEDLVSSPPPSFPLLPLISHTWDHYSSWNQHPTKSLLSLISSLSLPPLSTPSICSHLCLHPSALSFLSPVVMMSNVDLFSFQTPVSTHFPIQLLIQIHYWTKNSSLTFIVYCFYGSVCLGVVWRLRGKQDWGFYYFNIVLLINLINDKKMGETVYCSQNDFSVSPMVSNIINITWSLFQEKISTTT